jgi:excisionase family DNA binding protein
MPPLEQDLTTIYRTAKLAETLGVSVRTLERWRRDGVIPFIKVSRRVILYNLPEVLGSLGRFAMPAHRRSGGGAI